jgi:hypothetical protein
MDELYIQPFIGRRLLNLTQIGESDANILQKKGVYGMAFMQRAESRHKEQALQQLKELEVSVTDYPSVMRTSSHTATFPFQNIVFRISCNSYP